MSIFKDFLPPDPIFIGRIGIYRIYICGENPRKMMPHKNDIFLSYNSVPEPVFGFPSEKFFFGPVITAATLETPISKKEYEYYYGNEFKKFAHLVMDKMNLEAVHFFSREVMSVSYPFKFEREETEERGEIETRAEYDTMHAYIGDDFSLLHKRSNDLDDCIRHFIAKEVLLGRQRFDRETAHKIALYLSGSKEVTETQLQQILS